MNAPLTKALAERLREEAVGILAQGTEAVGLGTVDLLNEAAKALERAAGDIKILLHATGYKSVEEFKKMLREVWEAE